MDLKWAIFTPGYLMPRVNNKSLALSWLDMDHVTWTIHSGEPLLAKIFNLVALLALIFDSFPWMSKFF